MTSEQDGAGGRPAHNRVVVAVEATAASIEFFPVFRRLVLPQLHARLPPLGTYEIALLAFGPNNGTARCTLTASPWTADLAVFARWLDAVPSLAEGLGHVAAYEALSEAMGMLEQPSEATPEAAMGGAFASDVIMLWKLLFLLLHHGSNVLVFAPGTAALGARRSLQQLQDFAERSLAGQAGRAGAPQTPSGTLTKGTIVCALPLMVALHTRRSATSIVYVIAAALNEAAAADAELAQRLAAAGLSASSVWSEAAPAEPRSSTAAVAADLAHTVQRPPVRFPTKQQLRQRQQQRQASTTLAAPAGGGGGDGAAEGGDQLPAVQHAAPQATAAAQAQRHGTALSGPAPATAPGMLLWAGLLCSRASEHLARLYLSAASEASAVPPDVATWPQQLTAVATIPQDVLGMQVQRLRGVRMHYDLHDTALHTLLAAHARSNEAIVVSWPAAAWLVVLVPPRSALVVPREQYRALLQQHHNLLPNSSG